MLLVLLQYTVQYSVTVENFNMHMYFLKWHIVSEYYASETITWKP